METDEQTFTCSVFICTVFKRWSEYRTIYNLTTCSTFDHLILSFDVNKQLMIIVQKTHKVKESWPAYLQVRLVNVT